MRLTRGLLLFLFCASVWAEVCDPAKFAGPYSFLLSGNTTIAGPRKPTTSLGHLVFDGTGKVNGTSSAMFTGLLLGNPVTGIYEAHADCSLTWKLQDDSGAFQNFSGTMSADLSRVQFRQTDPGGAQKGIMQKSPEQCSEADLQPQYSYTVSGTVIPMQTGGSQSRTITGKGILLVAENSSLQVDSDCTVKFDLVLADSGGGVPMKMRGYLVNGGREILAIQTDPGAMVSGRFVQPAP